MKPPIEMPEDVYSTDFRLNVDETVDELARSAPRSIGLHRRIPSPAVATGIARRAVEVAVMAGLDAFQQVEAGEQADEWGEAQKAFANAATAIRHALKFMAREPTNFHRPKGSRPRQAYPDSGTQSLHEPLRQYYRFVARQAGGDIYGLQQGLEASNSLAAKGADTLADADRLLHELSHFAETMEAKIRNERSNPGDPVKQAFVAILVEVWPFLTGRRPGKQPERNPFLNFARRAWEDAGGSAEESFQHQILTALAALPDEVDPSADHYPAPLWL